MVRNCHGIDCADKIVMKEREDIQRMRKMLMTILGAGSPPATEVPGGQASRGLPTIISALPFALYFEAMAARLGPEQSQVSPLRETQLRYQVEMHVIHKDVCRSRTGCFKRRTTKESVLKNES